ncbi:hypothetical protein [Sphingomonas sp. CFBP 8760]|uniref:hypothetical protein n=1 Tax=Sphingomonas sp. CFBP 8760 TaxID=2775282 RepID=UPI001A92B313|nr:hypothetical protein [Sphingomonas sp. CFBP 8760]
MRDTAASGFGHRPIWVFNILPAPSPSDDFQEGSATSVPSRFLIWPEQSAHVGQTWQAGDTGSLF